MTTLDWTFYFALPIIAFIAIFAYQAYKMRQATLEKIRKSFGKKPSKKYYFEEFDNISHGFYLSENDGEYVDDITWNDLNMDQVFKDMDNTHSSFGQEALYKLLRTTNVSDEELSERERLMEYFTSHEDERVKLSYKFSGFGFARKMSIADYIEYLGECPSKSCIPNICLMLLFFAALAYCLLVDAVGGVAFVLITAGINISVYFKFKAEIENYFMCVKYIFAMCNCAEHIISLKSEGIKSYCDRMTKMLEELDSVRSFSFIMSSSKGNILEFVMEYVRMLTHLDIVKFYSVVKTLNQKKSIVWEMYETLGYIEAMIAGASYRAQLPYWSRPVFDEKGMNEYNAKELFHPLIENAVDNSIITKGSVLITGSNASGKSTFLRAAGINAILSQTFNTALARSYRASKFRVYSSMALKDNLMNNESYYMVEIKSLKRIMDAAENVDFKHPVLCFIDEVLRGTNTIERIAASSQILKRLSTTNTICFAATHDIELTSILENFFTNYHFSEEITDNDVKFNYKLETGRAVSRNAIKLLGLLGYKKEILDRAAQSAKNFEETGIWKQEN